jgi:hypothetical protein
MTYRSELRDAVGDALEYSEWAAVAAPQSFERVKSWGQVLSVDHYPVFGVSTRRQTTFEDTKDEYLREITLGVAWKREGNNDAIEDLIDEDADAIEELVLAALRPLAFNVTPADLTIDTEAADGGGRTGIGTYTFTCLVRTELTV